MPHYYSMMNQKWIQCSGVSLRFHSVWKSRKSLTTLPNAQTITAKECHLNERNRYVVFCKIRQSFLNS